MKKIGVISLFPFRPHVQNMAFLTKLLIRDGYEVRVLHCDAEFDFCYYKLFNDKKSKFYPNCLTCNIGSLKHFVSENLVDPISEYVNLGGADKLEITEEDRINAVNSIANVHRIEDYNELYSIRESEQYEALLNAKDKMNNAFYSWYNSRDLDGVVLFNGRMDLANSILKVCKNNNYPVVTVESSGSDRGLRIIPNENALSKVEFERLLENYIERPLTNDQLKVAITFFNGRLKRDNAFEWRQYHEDSNNDYNWVGAGKKVLILPSSNYEFYGNYDLSDCWNNASEGFKYILEKLNIKKNNILVRFHPNWARSIAEYKGKNSINHYKRFCQDNGYKFIESESKINTQALMEDADIVIVNGGSSAIEATLMGKLVYNVFPAKFSKAKFVTNIFSKNDNVTLEKLETNLKKERIKYCLRYLYFNMRRFPQYINAIRVKSSIQNEYNFETDSKQLTHVLSTQTVGLSDIEFDVDNKKEKKFVQNLFYDHRYYVDRINQDNNVRNSDYESLIPNGKVKLIYKIRAHL
ncbi:MAG: hypothetical protein WD512_19275, partial [Candidatus Paceibacterota bacterium]